MEVGHGGDSTFAHVPLLPGLQYVPVIAVGVVSLIALVQMSGVGPGGGDGGGLGGGGGMVCVLDT